MRMEHRLPKESRRDITGPESARESASTRASTKRDARLSVRDTLTDREPHENASCTNCVLTWGEKNFVKLTFTNHGVTVMRPEEGIMFVGKGIDVSVCPEGERKLTWMPDTWLRLFFADETHGVQE